MSPSTVRRALTGRNPGRSLVPRSDGAKRMPAGPETRMDRRLARFVPIAAAVAAVATGAATGPALAADTTFNPSVNFGISAISNVQYVGTGDRQSDNTGVIGISLPVRHFRAQNELRFNYRADYRKYSDESALDNLQQFAELMWTRRIRRQFRFSVAAEGALTQEQGEPLRGDETNYFLAQRTERRVYGGRMSFRHDFLRQRWQWGLALSGLNAQFRNIDDFQPDPSGRQVADQRILAGTVDVQRLIRRRYYVGAYFGYGGIQNDAAPDETVRRAGLEVERRVAERSSFQVRVGWFGRELDDEGAMLNPNFRSDGLDLNVRFNQGQEIGPVQLGFNVGVAPSTGGGIAGTSTNFYAGAQVSNLDRRATWNWQVGLRYAIREPTDNDALRLHTFSLLGEIERRIGRKAGLRLRTQWVKQIDDDPTRVDGEYIKLAAGVVWYPFGGSRVAVATGE